jgi:hypothetical protein
MLIKILREGVQQLLGLQSLTKGHKGAEKALYDL